mmetsp:Transcript_97705/g.280711  ORF Transcript_97705/g.280711 Transcript_97705/m.280711 type:complete len:271 (-) Transcript_97705:69-881(-)
MPTLCPWARTHARACARARIVHARLARARARTGAAPPGSVSWLGGAGGEAREKAPGRGHCLVTQRRDGVLLRVLDPGGVRVEPERLLEASSGVPPVRIEVAHKEQRPTQRRTARPGTRPHAALGRAAGALRLEVPGVDGAAEAHAELRGARPREARIAPVSEHGNGVDHLGALREAEHTVVRFGWRIQLLGDPRGRYLHLGPVLGPVSAAVLVVAPPLPSVTPPRRLGKRCVDASARHLQQGPAILSGHVPQERGVQLATQLRRRAPVPM